ncbi:MAG TPA: thiamine phosphate synthase [Rhodospirillales bacterium]|nr:thiamine phosphate synthase [Rhodospirillales bacterium]
MATLAELALSLNLRARWHACVPPMILMTDAARMPEPEPMVAALPAGSAVILRHYEIGDREPLARALLRLCRARGVKLLIAADVRLARAVGADGIHLPEALVRCDPTQARARRGPGWIVTAAAHGPRALRRAWRARADAALVAPVYATVSHPERPALGPLRFAALCRASPIPVYALGGITAESAKRLAHSGAAGIAAIGAFQDQKKNDRSANRRPRVTACASCKSEHEKTTAHPVSGM